MRIHREGVYYELIPSELFAAYEEQQHEFDVSDIEGWYGDMGLSEDDIDEIAYNYRENINDADCDWIADFYYECGRQAYNQFKAKTIERLKNDLSSND